jgi:PadR family transcriptional regulator, regulatory protein PadR
LIEATACLACAVPGFRAAGNQPIEAMAVRIAGSRQTPSIGCRLSTSMAESARYQNRIELLQGTLDLIVLQTLQWGPQHGYGIAQAIQAGSSNVLQVDTGSLYPALHRLERKKWIAATWRVSAHKQRTRVYRLTAAGRRQLAAERSRWQTLVDAMTGILARPQEG